MKYLLGLICIMFFIGCSSNQFSYLHIDSFRLSRNALKNNADIEVIYTSGGPNSSDLDFYYQCIVVDSLSDTVRILSPIQFDVTPEDNKRRFISMHSKDTADQLMLNAIIYDEIVEGKIEQMKPFSVPEITRVISFNEAKDLDRRNFKTVLGILVKSYPAAPDQITIPN